MNTTEPTENRISARLPYTTTDKATNYAPPDYARFKALVNYTKGYNNRGYCTYFSLDTHDGITDEQRGLEKIITFIKSIPPADLRLATIYANLTLDLSTQTKNYNFPVACYKPQLDTRGGLRIYNVWQKKTIVFMQIQNSSKVDITNTLVLAADATKYRPR